MNGVVIEAASAGSVNAQSAVTKADFNTPVPPLNAAGLVQPAISPSGDGCPIPPGLPK